MPAEAQSAMTAQLFAELNREFSQNGEEAVLARLGELLRGQERYHELFEVRKMQLRRRLGLSLICGQDGDQQLDEGRQRQLEDGLLEACREIGLALLGQGQIREGWMYLRPGGDHEVAARTLQSQEVTDENAEALVDVLLHEGVDAERGFQIVLDRYGTCNAITTLQSVLHGRPKSDRQACGRLLVRHVHQELLGNVHAHLERQGERVADGGSLRPLLERFPWLLEGGGYHIDPSHLASALQIATDVTDRPSLDLCLDLTEYGRRLDPQLQYPGEPPFVDLYAAMALFYGAQVGRDVARAVGFFRDAALATRPHDEGTAAIEVYVELLARLDRFDQALDAAVTLLPTDVPRTGRAPSLLELCRSSAQLERLQQVCQERNDLLGYTAALLGGLAVDGSPG
jgi:hypothetical protein